MLMPIHANANRRHNGLVAGRCPPATCGCIARRATRLECAIKMPANKQYIVAHISTSLARRTTTMASKANASTNSQPQWHFRCLPLADSHPKVGKNSSIPTMGADKVASNADTFSHPLPIHTARPKSNSPVKTKAIGNKYWSTSTRLPTAFLPTENCKYKDIVMIIVPQTTSAKPLPIANPSMFASQI